MDTNAVLISVLERFGDYMLVLAKEVDRLRLRIDDPSEDYIYKEEAADELDRSTRWIEQASKLWNDGDRARGLEHFHEGGKWVTTRLFLNQWRKRNRRD